MTDSRIPRKCGWTPYDGMEGTGWPAMTVVRGALVMRDGELSAAAAGGQALRFWEGRPA